MADSDTALAALNQGRQWVLENVDFDVSNVQVDGEYLLVDFRVTGPGGTVWFDDRNRILKPRLRVPDGTFTLTTEYTRPNGEPIHLSAAEFNALTRTQQRALTNTGRTWNRPNYVLAPRLAILRDLLHTARTVTKNWTVPHVMRDANGRLLGDTLTVFALTDGVIRSVNATIGTARSGSGLTADVSTPFVTESSFAGGTYRFGMGFLAFDTSALTASATLSAAIVSLAGIGDDEINTNSPTIQIKFKDYGAGDPTTGDWFNITTTGWTNLVDVGSKALNTWDGSGAYNAFSDAANYGSYSKTGTTRMVIGTSLFPTGTPTGDNSFGWTGSDAAGTTSDPKLVITYTLPVTGTIASTLAMALFTGTGAQTQTGTIVSTLKAATASLTGAQTQSGTVASTMQAATFSGSGEQSGDDPPTGTIASTMRPALFTATGAQTQTGAIDSSLLPALFSATGAQSQSGSIAATMQAATFSATGAQTQTGSIASTLRPATAAFVGVMQPSGVIAVTLQPALFSATGLHTQTGALASSMQALLFSGTGAQLQTGTIASTLQYALFTANGLIPLILLVGDARYAPIVASNARYGPLADLLARYEVQVKATVG